MNTTQIIILAIAVAVVLALALATWLTGRASRSKHLREKFGPEYDLALQKEGSKNTAEASLAEREKRVSKLEIHDLNEADRERYQSEWTSIQADFVDEPPAALEKANQLVTEVMIARGFPIADFETRAEDVSVLYPNFATDYRRANEIALKNKENAASTEDLRQAMVHYRSLFEQLLGPMKIPEVTPEDTKEVA